LLVDVAEHLRRVISAQSVVSSDQFTYARHFERVERAGWTVESDVVVLRWRCQRLRFVDKIPSSRVTGIYAALIGSSCLPL
jgi:hypothetical protein